MLEHQNRLGLYRHFSTVQKRCQARLVLMHQPRFLFAKTALSRAGGVRSGARGSPPALFAAAHQDPCRRGYRAYTVKCGRADAENRPGGCGTAVSRV